MKKALTIISLLFCLQSFAQDTTATRIKKVNADSFHVQFQYNKKIFLDKPGKNASLPDVNNLHYPAIITVYQIINGKKFTCGTPQKGIFVPVGSPQDDPYYNILKALKSSQ